MKKSIKFAASLGLAVTLLLTGCGQESTSTEEKVDQSTTEVAQEGAEVTTEKQTVEKRQFCVWHGGEIRKEISCITRSTICS